MSDPGDSNDSFNSLDFEKLDYVLNYSGYDSAPLPDRICTPVNNSGSVPDNSITRSEIDVMPGSSTSNTSAQSYRIQQLAEDAQRKTLPKKRRRGAV